MKHASLFSGLGGFDLAAQWLGWSNIFHSEIDPFCNKILNYHFPNSISYENIKKTSFIKHRGEVDILTGGFPCQPFSVAGKRNGTDDSRYLWPEMLRAIQEIRPRWIVAENVRGLLTWNEGLVFNTVCTDMENEGYEVLPFLLPACGVNAPHRRERIWIIAYSTDTGTKSLQQKRQNGISSPKITTDSYIQRSSCWRANSYRKKKSKTIRTSFFIQVSRSSSKRIAPDSNSQRCNCRSCNRERRHVYFSRQRITTKNKPKWKRWECRFSQISKTFTNTKCFRRHKIFKETKSKQSDGIKPYSSGFQSPFTYSKSKQSERMQFEQCEACKQKQSKSGGEDSRIRSKREHEYWRKFPTQSPICSRNDGISSLLDGITFPKWRSESVKGYGNAIVPQVALQIFRAIEEFERKTGSI